MTEVYRFWLEQRIVDGKDSGKCFKTSSIIGRFSDCTHTSSWKILPCYCLSASPCLSMRVCVQVCWRCKTEGMTERMTPCQYIAEKISTDNSIRTSSPSAAKALPNRWCRGFRYFRHPVCSWPLPNPASFIFGSFDRQIGKGSLYVPETRSSRVLTDLLLQSLVILKYSLSQPMNEIL